MGEEGVGKKKSGCCNDTPWIWGAFEKSARSTMWVVLSLRRRELMWDFRGGKVGRGEGTFVLAGGYRCQMTNHVFLVVYLRLRVVCSVVLR